MELVVNSYTYTLLAVAHTEGAAKLYLLANVVLCDELLKLTYYLTGALDVTGATDTYCDFKHLFVSVSIYLFSTASDAAEYLALFILSFFRYATALQTAEHITPL